MSDIWEKQATAAAAAAACLTDDNRPIMCPSSALSLFAFNKSSEASSHLRIKSKGRSTGASSSLRLSVLITPADRQEIDV